MSSRALLAAMADTSSRCSPAIEARMAGTFGRRVQHGRTSDGGQPISDRVVALRAP